ncbi:hypothetical protein PUN28_009164 [Cardiocondyla obscurior]|uniref:Uncharacterized protein n=1 Tax=Cardiocondyla obscurior TaxID=286306 RepID=A0AAW2FQT7_9HYME
MLPFAFVHKSRISLAVILTSKPVDIRLINAACKRLMEANNLKVIRTAIRRNLLSVLFPTVVVFAIYADLKRTANWKHQLAEQQKN